MSNDTNIESMIESLSGDLKPLKRTRHPAWRAIGWAGLVIAYVTVVLLIIGLRHDLAERLTDPHFVYEIMTVAMIGFAAACASIWLRIPDVRGNGWIVAVPTALAANFLLWMVTMGADDLSHLDHTHWNHCFAEGLFMAGIPAIVIAVISMRGNTTQPYKMAAMNTIAGASVASIGLRFSCGIDSMDHAILYHVLPFVVVGALLGGFARKIYRW